MCEYWTALDCAGLCARLVGTGSTECQHPGLLSVSAGQVNRFLLFIPVLESLPCPLVEWITLGIPVCHGDLCERAPWHARRDVHGEVGGFVLRLWGEEEVLLVFHLTINKH